jgi:hypothetical protein
MNAAFNPRRTYRDRVEIGSVYLPCQLGWSIHHTTPLFVMVDIVKGGGRAPSALSSLG